MSKKRNTTKSSLRKNDRPKGSEPASRATIDKARAEITKKWAESEAAAKANGTAELDRVPMVALGANGAKKGRKASKDATDASDATGANVGGPKAKTPKAPRTPKTPRTPKEPKPKRLSGLDLAAKVLAEAGEPLNAKTIAERAIAAGWKTSGATPHATLYAAIIREIAAKGREARFTKKDRGLFASNAKGGA
ncbi:MAG: hypothetical protein HRU76_13460 [Phycisphaeraceae bacterium]|nr:MAG: hypothetical protein HRU76_13460 [Phycisphaeraceae bacterium]